jgi:hypothetical protein
VLWIFVGPSKTIEPASGSLNAQWKSKSGETNWLLCLTRLFQNSVIKSPACFRLLALASPSVLPAILSQELFNLALLGLLSTGLASISKKINIIIALFINFRQHVKNYCKSCRKAFAGSTNRQHSWSSFSIMSSMMLLELVSSLPLSS